MRSRHGSPSVGSIEQQRSARGNRAARMGKAARSAHSSEHRGTNEPPQRSRCQQHCGGGDEQQQGYAYQRNSASSSSSGREQMRSTCRSTARREARWQSARGEHLNQQHWRRRAATEMPAAKADRCRQQAGNARRKAEARPAAPLAVVAPTAAWRRPARRRTKRYRPRWQLRPGLRAAEESTEKPRWSARPRSQKRRRASSLPKRKSARFPGAARRGKATLSSAMR